MAVMMNFHEPVVQFGKGTQPPDFELEIGRMGIDQFYPSIIEMKETLFPDLAADLGDQRY